MSARDLNTSLGSSYREKSQSVKYATGSTILALHVQFQMHHNHSLLEAAIEASCRKPAATIAQDKVSRSPPPAFAYKIQCAGSEHFQHHHLARMHSHPLTFEVRQYPMLFLSKDVYEHGWNHDGILYAVRYDIYVWRMVWMGRG